MTNNLVEPFMKKICKKQIKKSLELKKYSRGKVINHMLNRKNTIIRLITGREKRHSINEWIFSKTKYLVANVKVELGLSNYATKTDLKNATDIDKSDFAKKSDLANLQFGVDKLNIDKLKKYFN